MVFVDSPGYTGSVKKYIIKNVYLSKALSFSSTLSLTTLPLTKHYLIQTTFMDQKASWVKFLSLRMSGLCARAGSRNNCDINVCFRPHYSGCCSHQVDIYYLDREFLLTDRCPFMCRSFEVWQNWNPLHAVRSLKMLLELALWCRPNLENAFFMGFALVAKLRLSFVNIQNYCP